MLLRILLVTVGAVLVLLSIGWYFYLLPLGCGMNTTGCNELFGLFSVVSLLHFWPAFLIGMAMLGYGMYRR